MKKSIFTIILILTLAVNSFATPLAIPLIASALLHIGGAVAGLYYMMKPGSSSQTNTTGNIVSRPTSVTWVEMSGDVPVIRTDNINVNISSETLKTLVTAKPTTYPLLATYYVPPVPKPSYIGTVTGDYAMINDISHQMTVVKTPTCIGPGSVGSVLGNPLDSYGATQFLAGPSGQCTQAQLDAGSGVNGYSINYKGVPANPTVPTANQAVNSMRVTPDNFANPVLTPTIQSELDKMLQDETYIPTFTDATTGLPYVPPGQNVVLSPEQVAALDATNPVDNSTLITGSDSIVSAQKVHETAKLNAVGAQNRATADPSNAILASLAATAKLAEDRAKADYDKTVADQLEKKKAAADSVLTSPAPSASYGDGLTYSMGTRFTAFTNTMKSSGVFALPSQMLGNIPGGGTSSFNVSLGRFGSTVFDLAMFDSAIALLRIFVLMCFSVSGLKIILRLGGSSA